MAVRLSRAAVLAGLLVLLAAPSTARSEGSVDINTGNPALGRGALNSRGTELAGPGGPNGYTPCTFTAPANGIYAVVMFPYDTTNGSGVANGTITAPNVTNNQKLYLSLWDVTVVNASGNH